MYNFCVNVTVVIEQIVLLTAARALISVSYVYLRLFSVFVCLSFLSLLRNKASSDGHFYLVSCLYCIILSYYYSVFTFGK